MSEIIDESVSVNLLSSHIKHATYPWAFMWRNRQYRITDVGLHHTVREGKVLYHIFSVTDGTSSFKLKLDTETLGWRLVEIETQN